MKHAKLIFGVILGSGFSFIMFLCLSIIVLFASIGASGTPTDNPGDASDVSQSGFIKPLEGIMTERYGYVEDPFSYGGRMHNGMDIGCQYGANIVAAASGTIIHAAYSGEWGNYIKIRHENGLITGYAHLSGYASMQGDVVTQGQLIGYCGSTGASTGNHLHLEVYKSGKRVDPEPYFPPYKRGDMVS